MADESNKEDKSTAEPVAKAAKMEKATPVKKKSGPSKGTYPKPKNFAGTCLKRRLGIALRVAALFRWDISCLCVAIERMMNVLENGVYPDVISWYGEEDLVSVSIKGVKQSDILDDRFQGIRYAAFVRNLSRW